MQTCLQFRRQTTNVLKDFLQFSVGLCLTATVCLHQPSAGRRDTLRQIGHFWGITQQCLATGVQDTALGERGVGHQRGIDRGGAG